MVLIKISPFDRLPISRQNFILNWKLDNFNLYKSHFGSKTLTELNINEILSISDIIYSQKLIKR